jgi:4-hydroxythreonine-4-phosphate dehydrogenase
VNRGPLIGITLGDPSGIGPEIILKALSDPSLYESCVPVVLGDPGALAMILKESATPSVNIVSHPSEAKGSPGQIDLLAISQLNEDRMIPGKPTTEGGKAMVAYILKAVEMIQLGELSAMVTCPISKALMQEAGYRFEGHTELLAQTTGCRDYVMMLAGDRLRVALVTIHCALKDVPTNLDEEKIFRTIRITSDALRKDFGLSNPKIALAALNPHAGETGLFGSEETAFIEPAIKRAKGKGYLVEGPFPADTLFHRAVDGQFDVVIAMYHDQGLIPLKLLHFSDAVNVTLGLPIVRTSVDHGTAYEIAGKGVADPSSLKAAIRTAVVMATNRTKKGSEQ